MPDIPDNPSRDDAVAALATLKDLLSEFPFDSEVSRSVGLSAQISTVCRGAYPIVPVHIIDAPAAGTGKSYLLSTVSWIATGQAMPALGAGKDEKSWASGSMPRSCQGQPLICIDNVVGEIGGEAICRLTEQERPQVRILGVSVTPIIDARGITFFGNGNNIIVKGDFCRRVVRARLDSKEEHPESRQFAHPKPMDEILADRGEYIAACLTSAGPTRLPSRPKCCRSWRPMGNGRTRSARRWCGSEKQTRWRRRKWRTPKTPIRVRC